MQWGGWDQWMNREAVKEIPKVNFMEMDFKELARNLVVEETLGMLVLTLIL